MPATSFPNRRRQGLPKAAGVAFGFAALTSLRPSLVTAQTPAPAKSTSSAIASSTQKIDEEAFVSIGGIEQWVTIKGDDRTNPVILFLHGGPGDPLSPYADAIYGAWEKRFTLVQWDQRGSGKTYGRSAHAVGETLTIAQMSDDGAELARYLARHLGRKKVLLLGTSWGSILGVHMAKAHPELYDAYLGTSQVVSYRDNQAIGYAKLLGLARAADDKASVATLEALGAPPWTNPRSFGVVRRLIRKYEAKTTTPAPVGWWTEAAGYATPKDAADREAGEDFSFLRFVGLKGDGMFSQVELPKLGTTFALPVFFVEGAEDLLMTPDVAKRYFDTLTAPQKQLVVVERAGHDPNQAVVDAQYKLLEERVVPLMK